MKSSLIRHSLITTGIVLAALLGTKAHADETQSSTINSTRGDGSASVEMTINATNVNMTIPTVVPIVFANNGGVVTANNYRIINNTIGNIYLQKATITGNYVRGTTGPKWQVASPTENMQNLDVDTPKVKFRVGYQWTPESMKYITPTSDPSVGQATWNSNEGTLVPYGKTIDNNGNTNERSDNNIVDRTNNANVRTLRLEIDHGPVKQLTSGDNYTLGLVFQFK